MALSGSLPQINLGVQGVTQGGHHRGTQRVNPEFRVGSNFRIIPEQYFSGVENVVEFLENIDNNLTYYEIPTQLACAYLKGHLTGRTPDWFEVLGYRVVEDKVTDYAHLKQALSEQFPVVRNRSELETRFYSSSQKHNQQPSDFVYDLLTIHKILKLEMTEEKLIDHIISRLEPQILDYVEGVADNQRFDGRRRGGQSDHRFHNQGGRQGGSRNSAFREQPGLTHVLYHKIDTGDKGLVVSRPYRYDRVKQGIIDYHIEKMLQEGRIRPIQSPYASPVVLTRKNTGLPPDSPEAYRFAIDYRKLNAITKYPRYPLLMIDDIITNIPHTGVMSTLDLKSRYFQSAISPKDIEKTTFITRNGTFAFLRMSFGLSGATPNFQKAIDIILKLVIGRFVSVYMDDVIITSPSFNEHLDHLNQVFTLLRDAGLTLNKEKCHFARDKLKYLGLVISKEGIETDNSKVKAITEMKPPKNSKEVSKFLGMAGWYQKFIPKYADMCEPLYRLKKKGAKFNWSTEAQDSFDKIKRALTEAPVLQLPNFTEQFNLFTDASGVGIGAVLKQNH
ncbi:retrovirus-related Pol polyprotein from transposon 297 [Trichonephila clavipes]|nr:retrovirus-related Pol polyprotein from transposon 297 [Trichonephila clavipes]